jgi:large subunit ribosomal protein L4
MKIKVYNLQGKATGEMELSDQVFGVKSKQSVVHEVFVQMTNNQREPWADTKGKGEVRGGGRKPWQQKGTGRARHGSTRSPIWKGGGVVFGPKTERNYSTKINKKTRQLVTRMCLSDKLANDNLVVVDDLTFTEIKTKVFTNFVKVLPPHKSWLVLTAGKNDSVLRMTGNLKKLLTRRAQDANVIDLLNQQAILTDQAGIKKLEETFGK